MCDDRIPNSSRSPDRQTASEGTTEAPRPLSPAEQLHERLRKAVQIERRAIREIALGLAEMNRTQLYKELGYAGLTEYGEQAFGFSSRKIHQLALLGRRLPELPALDVALCTGALGWTKARTVSQIATPDTVLAWVQRAMQVNSRDLEGLAVDARLGDPPPDAEEDWQPPRHVWAKFRLDVFHFERLMQALNAVRQHLGDADMSSSQLLLFLAERWLDEEREEEEESADSEGTVAHVCGETAATSGPQEPDQEPEDLAKADPAPGDEATEAPSPQLRNAANTHQPIHYRIVEHRCPSCEKAWTETLAGRIEMDSNTRALAECDAEVVAGDDSAGTLGHLCRTIPPATRRAVFIRDKGRCAVPGCRNHKHLDLHHIKHYSRKGSHDPSNLVSICSTHHGLVHRDVLRVTRNADGTLCWERGFGEPLGVLVKFWQEQAELDHGDLEQFDGPPGSWPCIEAYWPGLEPPEGLVSPADGGVPESDQDGEPTDCAAHVCDEKPTALSIKRRYPRGRQLFRIGDEQRVAPPWLAPGIRA